MSHRAILLMCDSIVVLRVLLSCLCSQGPGVLELMDRYGKAQGKLELKSRGGHMSGIDMLKKSLELWQEEAYAKERRRAGSMRQNGSIMEREEEREEVISEIQGWVDLLRDTSSAKMTGRQR